MTCTFSCIPTSPYTLRLGILFPVNTRQENPQLVPVVLDVRFQDSVDKCMDIVQAELRNHDMKLIGLVNNAGIGKQKPDAMASRPNVMY